MGIETNKDTTTRYICITAKARRRREAFSMAVSPPVIAIIATAGARRRKWRVWSPQENVQSLSNGPTTIQTNIPSRAVIRHHARTTLIKWEIRSLSPSSKISERWRTALKDIPRQVVWDMKLTAELNNDVSPIPPSEKHGDKFITYKADQNVESLYATEYSSVFQYMAVTFL